MSNYLVLIHDVLTGNVVRQIVVKAESAIAAVEEVGDRIGVQEHGIAIPTGSEPDPATESQMQEPEPAAETAPDPVIPQPPAPEDQVIDELKELPADLLQKIIAKLTGK